MVELVPIFLMILAASGAVVARKNKDECKVNHQCLPGYFCYASTKVCAPCSDCAAYNRLPGKNSCAKSSKECGACLKGFNVEELTNNIQREACVAEAVLATDSPPVKDGVSESLKIIAYSAVPIFAVILVSSIFYTRSKKARKALSEPPDIELAPLHGSRADPKQEHSVEVHAEGDRPPPYTPHQPRPSAPPEPRQELEPCSAVVTHLVRVDHRSEVKNQNAVPFMPAQHPYGQSDEEDETNDGVLSPTPPDLDDDSTMESGWTPNRGNAAADDSGISSNPASSTASLDVFETAQPTVQPSASAPTSPGGGGDVLPAAVVRRPRSPDRGNRRAKRHRPDSGSRSVGSSGDEDPGGDAAPGQAPTVVINHTVNIHSTIVNISRDN